MVEKLQGWHGGGGGARINTLGAPAGANQIEGWRPSLQVQVEPVVRTPYRKQNNSDFGAHTRILFKRIFVDKTPLVALVFYLVLVLPDFDPNGSGIRRVRAWFWAQPFFLG